MGIWNDQDERPLPAQPAEPDGPFELQRPSRAELDEINDPYGDRTGARYIVLDRYRLRVPDPERPNTSHLIVDPEKRWGRYQIHGDQRPSLFKTWMRATAQALGVTARWKEPIATGPRPGAILVFDMRAMPVVTSEEEARTVVSRPQANRVWEQEDEHQFAERMANEWMEYAAKVRR